MKTEFDVLIIGAGLVGLTTALTCAASGASVAILDRKPIEIGQDGRASALSSTSLRLFSNLGVDIQEQLQPIHDMLVTEGAPQSPWRLHFGTDAKDLGAIIENPLLKSALIEKIHATDVVQIFAPVNVMDFKEDAGGVHVETDQGLLKARLLIGADGRESAVRRKAGITLQRFDYNAASLVTTISHTLAHDDVVRLCGQVRRNLSPPQRRYLNPIFSEFYLKKWRAI